MNKPILDQFYTNPKISDRLVNDLIKIYSNIGLDIERYEFIEPSAGSGNFIDSLTKKGINKKNIKGYDLEPKAIGIKKQNFLELNKKYKKKRIIIGNPPFGKRSKLAIEFINHAAKMSDTIAMILPKQFNRFLTQKSLNNDLRLIFSREVEEDAFLVHDKKYDVKTIFQIWTKDNDLNEINNIRKLKQDPITHEDLISYIHNNTKSTLKYFNKKNFDWDYAVHRQGFYDYNKLITNQNDLKTNRQYLFIKLKDKKYKKIIKRIDFCKLSKSNTQTPGFSKTDFIREYKKIKKGMKNETIHNTKFNKK